MIRIRLTRMGSRNNPFYRIAVFDSRTKRDGRYIENIGTYDPMQSEPTKKVKIKKDRFEYWLSVGAKPTEALEKILSHARVFEEERPLPESPPQTD
jgi:small subunit ribosomal protein S16